MAMKLDPSIRLYSEVAQQTFYYNKSNRRRRPVRILEKRLALTRIRCQVFQRTWSVIQKLGMSTEDRIAFMKYADTFVKRDDVFIEYITMKNFVGEHEKPYIWTAYGRKFHPWEGGEGKATTRYATALVRNGEKSLQRKRITRKQESFLWEKALVYPENLGRRKAWGEQGQPYQLLSVWLWQRRLLVGGMRRGTSGKTTTGTDEPAGIMFYYDQPADVIMYQGMALEKLKKHTLKIKSSKKLISYGEAHIYDEAKMDLLCSIYPDLQILRRILPERIRLTAITLMGLGNLGLKNIYGKDLSIISKIP